MSRFAIIEGGKVANIAEAEPDFAESQGWVETNTANIGDTYRGGQFIKPELDPEIAIQANVVRAKAELIDSDWSDLPSVRNTAIEPHLLNGADFDTYRASLRAVVVGRPAEVQVWPVSPDAVWSQ